MIGRQARGQQGRSLARSGMERRSKAMIRENQQLFADEPVEFTGKPVEVQDCRKITDHFRGFE